MRRTSPAARMNSPSASRSGDSAGAGAAAGGDQHGLCRVRALGQPSPLSGRADLSELLVAEVEPHRARALHLLAGPAPWPGARR